MELTENLKLIQNGLQSLNFLESVLYHFFFVSAYLTIFHFAYDAVRILKTEAYIPRIEYEKGLAEFPQTLPVADQIDITSLWFGIRGDPYENRTRVTAVKGRCLNRLTNGP